MQEEKQSDRKTYRQENARQIYEGKEVGRKRDIKADTQADKETTMRDR
jgi:hypothetical protein